MALHGGSLAVYVYSCSYVCDTADQLCYGGHTSGVFTGHLSVSVSLIVKILLHY